MALIRGVFFLPTIYGGLYRGSSERRPSERYANPVWPATQLFSINDGREFLSSEDTSMPVKICLDRPYSPDVLLSKKLYNTRKAFTVLLNRCINDRCFLDEAQNVDRAIDSMERVINRQLDAMGMKHV